jgi:hypothetical protein
MLRFLGRWPLLLPGLVTLALFLYMTWPGFGGTSDSRNYLWAAHTLRETGQLLAPNGTPYRFWGPLYPVLLAVCYSPAAVRVLHGAALLVNLVLWGRIGYWLLPPGRAAWLPWVMALSAAVLVPAKFIWSETVFGALAAAYFYALLAWSRNGQPGWLGLATAAGLLLPLQRTAGFFLLAGAGAGLLLTGHWRGHGRALLLHWVGCAVGGLAWSYYAEVVAGPRLYQTPHAWDALGSLADYGYVLARWFVPLAAAWRPLAPGLWALLLPVLLLVLYPQGGPKPGTADSGRSPQSAAVAQPVRLLWWVVVLTLGALLLATNAGRAAAGPHNAERYGAVLVGPVGLLVLMRWPDTTGAPFWRKAWRWTGRALLAGWLAYSAVRAGHNTQQLRQREPMAWPEAASL